MKPIRYIKELIRGKGRSAIVKKNIIASLILKCVSILVSLILVPMTLGYVSSEIYGIWLVLSSVVVWLSFFDIGFTQGLKNKLAEAIALKDWKRGKTLVSTTYFMMVIIFIPLCVVLELIVPLIDWTGLLNINHIYNDEIIKVIYILIGLMCLQMIANVLISVIAAFQKVALASSIPVIGNTLSLLMIYILTKTCPPSLVLLAFAITAMPIIITIIATFILFNGKFNLISPSFSDIDIHIVKSLFNLGARFFLIQIQFLILYQCTNFLISNVSGPTDVTSYNIAYKYMGISMMIFNIILAPLWPAYTDAYTKKDFIWMKNIYRKMTKLYLLSVVCLVIMLAISPIVYKIWIGDKAIIPFSMTFVIFIYMVIHNWDGFQVSVLNGTGKITIQTYLTVFGAIIYIPISLFLSKTLGLGAIGIVISMIFVDLIYSLVFTRQSYLILNDRAKGLWNK